MSHIPNTSGFDDRFLAKLSKVDRQGIETYLTNLVREKHFLQVVFNAVLDGLVVLRPNLEVLYINDAAVELLGINKRARIYREHFASLVDLPGLKDMLARFALNHDEPLRTEIEVGQPATRWMDVSIRPIESSNNLTGTAVVIIHDITEIREAQAQREKADRVDTLARLTASLAHEIKNPLNSLQIHAQLLNRALKEPDPSRVDPARVEQSSNVMLEEINRLNKVVNDFLAAVRPTRPMKNSTDINALIQHVHATLLPEMEARGIACQLQLDHEISPVQIDQAQLTQAVLNLVKNSMEALQERKDADKPAEADDDEWTPTMQIQTRITNDHYQVRIADNGAGISEENILKVLEPYYTTKFSGTGLGLSIVSRIVEEHGGVMDIASRPGTGTVVTLTLPLDGKPIRLLTEKTSDAGDHATPSVGISNLSETDDFPYESI